MPSVKLLLDNKAALTIAECGASWRTRYFSVRAHRLHEEHLVGRAVLEYCKTDVMLADALTKLPGAPVIVTLHHCMNGGDVSQDSQVSSAVAEVCDCESGEPVVLDKPQRKKSGMIPHLSLKMHKIPLDADEESIDEVIKQVEAFLDELRKLKSKST